MEEKRTYKKLTDREWIEAEAIWERGVMTAQALADKFGVSKRTILKHMGDNGIEKGSKIEDVREQVQEAVVQQTVDEVAVVAKRIKETNEQHYEWQTLLDKLIMQEIAKCRSDNRSFATAMGAIKALEKAKSALALGMNARRVILGMDDKDGAGDELPELIVRNLTPEQIEDIQRATMRAGDTDMSEGELEELESLAEDDVVETA